MIVTNIKGWNKKGKKQVGFYMDGYLKANLDGIPNFLAKEYDCVGIVSGQGKVRIGKSTAAIQVGAYVAWRLAGGEIKAHQEVINNKEKWIIDKVVNPKKKVRFNLEENVAFSAEQMMDTAHKLYNKYGPNQVIVYDEGRQGLDSARAMESINKGMEDFFQECGFMGHVILIVLPSFFKLHEDYAVARSLFLINVYSDRQFNRGYFNFYKEFQKEKLFFFGKKRIGIRAKYHSATPNFYGRFTGFTPFNKEDYNRLKKKALLKKRRTRIQRKFKKQRDATLFLLKKYSDLTYETIAQDLSAITNQKISIRTIKYAVSNISHQKVSDMDD